jgi:DNA-binding FrmR family transcriptional regulator
MPGYAGDKQQVLTRLRRIVGQDDLVGQTQPLREPQDLWLVEQLRSVEGDNESWNGQPQRQHHDAKPCSTSSQ